MLTLSNIEKTPNISRSHEYKETRLILQQQWKYIPTCKVGREVQTPQKGRWAAPHMHSQKKKKDT